MRALAALGAFGDALAREVLEACVLDVEPDAVAWDGTNGHVQGMRARIVVPEELRARAEAHPATHDALAASIATALIERPGHALTTLVVEAGEVPPRGGEGPYRTSG